MADATISITRARQMLPFHTEKVTESFENVVKTILFTILIESYHVTCWDVGNFKTTEKSLPSYSTYFFANGSINYPYSAPLFVLLRGIRVLSVA